MTEKAEKVKSPKVKTPKGGSFDEVNSGEDSERFDSIRRSTIFCLTLISLYVGASNLTKFPLLVFQHGGLYFVGVNLIGTLLVAWPLSFFECLLGQLTQKGLSSSFAAYGKAYQGIGWSIALTAISGTLVDDHSIGNSAQMLMMSFTGTEALECSNHWNNDECVTLQEQYKCNATMFYQKACHTDVPPFEVKDATIQHYEFFHGSTNTFNAAQFVTIVFCWTIMLPIVFLGPKALMIAFSAMGVFSITLLLPIACKIFSFGNTWTGIVYLWHSSLFFKFMTLESWSACASQMIYSVGLGSSFVSCIASFRKPKESCFLPSLIAVLVDFAISLFCLLIACGVVGTTIAHKQKTSYLFTLFNPGDYGRGMLPQILASNGSASFWIGLLAFVQLILALPYLLSPIFFMMTVVRDNFDNTLKALIVAMAATEAMVVTACLLLSLPSRYVFSQMLNPYEICLGPLFFFALCAVVRIYGTNEWCIDICQSYGEIDNKWRAFSPSGSLMFFSWTYCSPILLVFTHVFVVLKYIAKAYTENGSGIGFLAWSMSVILLLLIPGWFLAAYIKNRHDEFWKLFYPNSSHPSYERIMATYGETSFESISVELTTGVTTASEIEAQPSVAETNLLEKKTE